MLASNDSYRCPAAVLVLGVASVGVHTLLLNRRQSAQLEKVKGAAKIQEVIHDMNRRPEDPQAQAHGCGELGGTAYHGGKATQDLVVRLGGVHACVKALKRHGAVPAVVAQCGSGLGGIIVFNHEACRVSAEAGGIEALAAGIRAHPNNRWVATAIDVFSSHCDVNPENRPRVRLAGGIDLIFETMRRFYWDSDVQFKNWAGLSATVHDRGNQEAIARGAGWCPPGCGSGKLQGIELLVQTMRDHGSASHRVDQEAMQVVKGLADHSAEYREALVSAGVVEEIVRAVREEKDELGTPCVGAEALLPLASGNATHKAGIGRTGVIGDVLSAMQARAVPDQANYGGVTNSYVWPMLPSGCWFLSAMAAGSQEYQHEILQTPGAASLLQTLRSQGDPATREACAAALRNLHPTG